MLTVMRRWRDLPPQGNVLRRILGQAGGLVVAGLVIGLPLSWMAAHAIRGFLFDVGTSDPVDPAIALRVG
ncbi:MAG: hypothetical protein JWL61_4123 [Gemmatimonadetes bacterium]|nr:hypothetical protein [Gemmatimonadota bacterium]